MTWIPNMFGIQIPIFLEFHFLKQTFSWPEEICASIFDRKHLYQVIELIQIDTVLISTILRNKSDFYFSLSIQYNLIWELFIVTPFSCGYPPLLTPWVGVLHDESNCLLLPWGACSSSLIWTLLRTMMGY